MKFKLAIFLFSLVLSILVAENVAYYYLEGKFFQDRNYRFTENRLFGECFSLSDEFIFEPNWGKCGMMDIEKEVASKNEIKVLGVSDDDVFTILALGDSATYRSSYPQKLEEGLNKFYGDKDRRFKVIKLGVEAYNTAQELELLRKKALDLEPDLVLLQFHLNDFDFSEVIFKVENGFLHLSSKKERMMKTNSTLFSTSSLYRLYVLSSVTFTKDEKVEQQWEDREEMVKVSLVRIQQLLSKEEIPLVVAVFPVFQSEQWEPNRSTVLNLLRELEIDYIDLLGILETNGGTSRFAVDAFGQRPDVLHPNNEADILISEELVRFLKEKIY